MVTVCIDGLKIQTTIVSSNFFVSMQPNNMMVISISNLDKFVNLCLQKIRLY